MWRRASQPSICLNRFPIGGLREPNIQHQSVCFTRMWDFTWRVSDWEELVCVQIEFIHPFFGYLCYRDTMFA